MNGPAAPESFVKSLGGPKRLIMEEAGGTQPCNALIDRRCVQGQFPFAADQSHNDWLDFTLPHHSVVLGKTEAKLSAIISNSAVPN